MFLPRIAILAPVARNRWIWLVVLTLLLGSVALETPANAVQLGLLSSESVYYYDTSVTPNPMVDLPFGDWSGKVVNDTVHNILKVDVNADQDGIDGLYGGIGHALVPSDFSVSATSQIELVLRVDPLNQADALWVSLQDSDPDVDEFAADSFLYQFDLTSVTPGSFVTLTQPLNAPGPVSTSYPVGYIPGDGTPNYGLSGIGIQSILNGTERLKIDLKEVRVVDTSDPALLRATSSTFDQSIGRYAWYGFNPSENSNAHNDTSGDTIVIDVAPAPTPSPTNGNGTVHGGIGTPWLASLSGSATEYQLEVDVKVLPNNAADGFAIALQDKDPVTIEPVPGVFLDGEALEQFLYTFDLAGVSDTGFTTLTRRLDQWDGYYTPVTGPSGLPDGIINLDPGLFQLEIEGLESADRINIEVAAIRLVAAPAGLLGDYNEDDVIDAADYTTWRDALTAGATSLPNDPTPGVVDETDFTYWRSHFGELLGGGSGSAAIANVPEPTSLVLMMVGTFLAALGRSASKPAITERC